MDEEGETSVPLLEKRSGCASLVARLREEHEAIRRKREDFANCLQVAGELEDNLPRAVLRDLVFDGWELWTLMYMQDRQLGQARGSWPADAAKLGVGPYPASPGLRPHGFRLISGSPIVGSHHDPAPHPPKQSEGDARGVPVPPRKKKSPPPPPTVPAAPAAPHKDPPPAALHEGREEGQRRPDRVGAAPPPVCSLGENRRHHRHRKAGQRRPERQPSAVPHGHQERAAAQRMFVGQRPDLVGVDRKPLHDDVAPDAGAQRFGDGFFGGKTRGQRLVAMAAAMDFRVSVDAVQETIAVARDGSADALDFNDVDAGAQHGAHTQLYSSRSGPAIETMHVFVSR